MIEKMGRKYWWGDVGDPPNDKTLYYREYEYGQWGILVLGYCTTYVSIIVLGSLIEWKTILLRHDKEPRFSFYLFLKLLFIIYFIYFNPYRQAWWEMESIMLIQINMLCPHLSCLPFKKWYHFDDSQISFSMPI